MLRVEGKENSLFPRGQLLSVLLYFPSKKIEKKCEENDLPDAYGGCTCNTSGSHTELSCRNDTITVLFFAADKLENSTEFTLATSNA